MTMPGDTERPYRVVYSEIARKALKELGLKAKRQRLVRDLVAALRIIESHLRSDPLLFGEPRHDLVAAGLQVRIGGHQLLFVRYGVDETRRIVYVIDCIGSSAHGF